MPEGLKQSLKTDSQNDSDALRLRPLAAQVRSIWPFWRWALGQEMKSSAPYSPLEPPLPRFSQSVPSQFSWTLTQQLGDWIAKGCFQSLPEGRGQYSPFTSTGSMQVLSRSLASR